MILVLSHAADLHTREVVRHLDDGGHQVHLLDFGRLPLHGEVELRWEPHVVASKVTVHDHPIDLSTTGVVWWRRIRPFEVDQECTNQAATAFAKVETSRALNGALDNLTCPWVNARAADEAASSKTLQWFVARRVGLEIPRTLVTNRATKAREFVDRLRPQQVIYKPLEQPPAWRETRLFQADDFDRLESVRVAPVVLQEYIPGIDVRTTIVNGQLFSAAIDARRTSYPVDMRVVLDEAHITPMDLPRRLEGLLLRMMTTLGLMFGAIDLRIASDGTFYFLEVNPAGQWLFVEQAASLPISKSVAELLARANAFEAG